MYPESTKEVKVDYPGDFVVQNRRIEQQIYDCLKCIKLEILQKTDTIASLFCQDTCFLSK